MKRAVVMLFLLSGCWQEIDLRMPACLVIPTSGQDVKNEGELDEFYRVVISGWNDWTRHLPDVPPPQVVTDKKYCKYNPGISFRLKVIDKDLCGRSYHLVGEDLRVQIQSEDDYPCEEGNVPAHEIGHILLESGDHVTDRSSVMNPLVDAFPPLPEDLEMLCRHHPEITCPKFEWCKGTFDWPGWCPSDNPDDGLALLLSGQKAGGAP